MPNISNGTTVDVDGRFAAALLALVTVLLASLAPWGPIENRSFEHLHPGVYWGFNAFLVALVLCSVATAVFLWRGRRWAVLTAAVLAALYVLVYVLDLLEIFPTSPDPMGTALYAIEVVDTVLAASLVGYSYRQWVELRAKTA